jgi:hypothetical protein
MSRSAVQTLSDVMEKCESGDSVFVIRISGGIVYPYWSDGRVIDIYGAFELAKQSFQEALADPMRNGDGKPRGTLQ